VPDTDTTTRVVQDMTSRIASLPEEPDVHATMSHTASLPDVASTPHQVLDGSADPAAAPSSAAPATHPGALPPTSRWHPKTKGVHRRQHSVWKSSCFQ
jgi:hypothetical protein